MTRSTAFAVLLALFAPAVAAGQAKPKVPPKVVPPKGAKEAVEFLATLEQPDGGFINDAAKPENLPTLTATLAAVRAFKALGADVPNADKHAEFVLKCYDEKGGFRENPRAKQGPTARTTAVGILACAELGVATDKIKDAPAFLDAADYHPTHCALLAAAVNAWGGKWPGKADAILEKAEPLARAFATGPGAAQSFAVYINTGFRIRGGINTRLGTVETLRKVTMPDGGWGLPDAKTSDLETTAEVCQALAAARATAVAPAKIREFVASCKNKDGGYGVKPGDPSTAAGTAAFAVVAKFVK